MRVNAPKTSRLVLSCSLQVNVYTEEQVEKFKYIRVMFTGDRKLEEEIHRRIGAASGVLDELARSTVTKAELSLKTKFSVFKSIFTPMLTCGHESWTITEKLRTRVQAPEMGFLRGVAGLTRLDIVGNTGIRKSPGIEPLLPHSGKSQVRWFAMCCECLQKGKLSKCFCPADRQKVERRQRIVLCIYIEGVYPRLQLSSAKAQALALDREHWKHCLKRMPLRLEERSGHGRLRRKHVVYCVMKKNKE
ncbi:unnamed protein product [Soboliphyme baturini]|uniref:Retrovirus-related Pol polyprotein from type-2 retrotransposable element R2DM n=1 Tax=Soboliphyme baturini TaxID=241478 RepID=A0A183IPR0_9BILA|nr:unnamed protein product [Soboliphyme baturini]